MDSGSAKPSSSMTGTCAIGLAASSASVGPLSMLMPGSWVKSRPSSCAIHSARMARLCAGP